MYLILILFYSFFLSVILFGAYAWHRDLFHPAIILAPQFLFIYAVLPLYLLYLDTNTFAYYISQKHAVYYQWLVIALTAAFFLGVGFGSRKSTFRPIVLHDKYRFYGSAVYAVGVIFGILGLAAWIYSVANRGGILEAYGQAYGGGRAGSGYIKEAQFLGLVAVPLIYSGRIKSGMRQIDWILLILLISPVVFHGVLGARRGPTFMAIVVVVGGWLYLFRKRIPLLLGVGGGVAAGLLIVLLVVNREAIYIGSSEELTTSFDEFFERWNSNEYLYGSAVVRYADGPGGYFYGARILAQTIAHFIPSQLWPTQYDDVTAWFGLDIDLWTNAGIDLLGITRTVGWTPSVGAAPGIIGDVWLEFGYLAPLVMLLIGILYGRTWRYAERHDQYRLVYILMVAISVYLVTQSLGAWSFRLILFGSPLLALAWISSKRRRGGASYRPAEPQQYGQVRSTRRTAAS